MADIIIGPRDSIQGTARLIEQAITEDTAIGATDAVPRFLRDGGEMGALMRAHDWSNSSLGLPVNWPQALRTAVRLMLNTGHPMYIWWGAESACLYNDAYRQSIGPERHPSSLGRPAREVWAEIWDIIGPQIEQVRSGGGSTWHQDHLVPITRHGRREEVYWTYSYSPIDDETAPGGIGGVLVTCTETTEKVLAARHLAAERDRFARLFELSPTFMALLQGPTHRFELANPSYLKLVGYRDVIGKTVAEAFPEAIEQGYVALLDQVFATGAPFAATARRLELAGPGGRMTTSFIDFVYQPVVDAKGSISGIFVEGFDVTERVEAEAALSELNATLEARVVEQAREHDRVWRNSRDIMVVIGANGIFRAVSPAWSALLGHAQENVVGHSVLEFIHHDDAGLTREGLEAAASGSDLTNFENRYLHRDGSPRWISWHTAREGDLVYAYGRDITAEKNAADRLALSEARLRAIFENSYMFQGIATLEGTLLDANSTSLRAIDCAPEQVIGKQLWDTPWFRGGSGMGEKIRTAIPLAARGETVRLEMKLNLPVGGSRWFDFVLRPMRDSRDRIVAVIAEAMELTARKLAEEALVQAQKMEAVGQLTGGIAHDFNNLLAGISGSLELLERRIAEGRLGGVDRYISGAQDAARRAAALTQRLLAFSRRQTLDARPTDVNRMIAGMEELIRRTVGPSVAVEVVGAGGLWLTKVDPSQLENALLNLCINARDAMAPDGGRLTIETANKWLDDRAAAERELTMGQYISLCVTDTGTGMEQDVVSRAFDPFFTTKPLGQGTGLGLSMVYGFVRQSGGQVRIYSEVGMGTTVCLYLPRYQGALDPASEPIPPENAEGGIGETVLVVDDEPSIRMLIKEVLEEIGYQTIEATDGPAALAILQSSLRVDLMITDVGLPGGMNGRQVADAARTTRPELKVLFITGYAENAVIGSGRLEAGMEVMTKPFVIAAMGNKVRKMIEG